METKSIDSFEAEYLKLLLQRTLEMRGDQYPNPAVGAMVIKDNTIISEGYHQCSGEAHAEVIALDKAGDLAIGATLLITLEPCTTHGKTPPCTDRIIESGIQRVIWAVDDPNPTITNTADDQLSFHGITAIGNVDEQLGLACIKEFDCYHRLCRPYVYVKAAVSVDHMIAPHRNGLTYISSDASLKKVQQLRRYCQAICVGVHTIKIDQPKLSIRDQDSQPMIVILDPMGEIDRKWLMVALESGRTVMVFTRGVDLAISHDQLICNDGLTLDKTLNWKFVLSVLYQHKIQGVLIEGGAGVFQSVIDSKLLDELWIFRVPKLLASEESVSFCGYDELDLTQVHQETLTDDELTIYKNNNAFSI